MKILLFTLLICTICFSQKISFVYETKYILNHQKPEDLYTDNMILDLLDHSSIFRELQEKKTDSITLKNGNGMFKMGVENQFYVKKDLKQNKVYKLITYLGNNYLLPMEEKLNWKIFADQKTVGKYKVQKAETSYGGRNWIAWFTTELPFSDGPYIFNGLPGLIVSLQDQDNDYSFNLIQVKRDQELFDARTKTIKIDWEKYETLAKSYYNDPYDLNSKLGRKVTMTDPTGNLMDLSEVSKQVQNEILQSNNPIELNRKITYK